MAMGKHLLLLLIGLAYLVATSLACLYCPSPSPKSPFHPKPPITPLSKPPYHPKPPFHPQPPHHPKPPYVPKPPHVPKPPFHPKPPYVRKPRHHPKPPIVHPPHGPKPPYGPKPPAACPPPMPTPKPPPKPKPPIVKPPPKPKPPVVKPPVVFPPPKPPVVYPPPPPPPAAPQTCPIDTLKLGGCVDVLGGLVHIGIGSSAKDTCCPVLQGLLDLDAAVCLCTTMKAKLLNMSIVMPLALQVMVECAKTMPPGFQCPA
ncbi:VQ domain-containing protein [Psidium guajava]|nr:VQ domain-containing protein [Psidium guajava]